MTQATAAKPAETITAADDVQAPARFSVAHHKLTEALNVLSIAVPSHPPVPVLGGIIARARGSALTLRAFDYEVSAAVRVDAEPGGMGISLLDHSELKKLAAACVAGETKAAAARTPVGVSGDVLATPDLAVPLTLLPLAEYPSFPQAAPPMVTIDGPEWFRQLARVLPAAGTDETLPALTTVRFEVKPTALRMAACDRYRLAIAEVPAQAWDEDQEAPAVALVPADVLRLVAKRLGKYSGPISVGVHTAQADILITFSVGPVELTVRSREGDFPKVDTLMPTERPTTVEADRAALAKAAKKAHALAKCKGSEYLGIEFAPGGRMTLTPTMDDVSEQDKVKGVHVDAHVVAGSDQFLGKPLGLDGRYLLDALETFTGDSVTLHLADPTKSVVLTDGHAISGEGYRHLLMPVRLEE